MGIFGGSFDPPHIAHLELLQELQKKAKFDRIIIVPSHFPPGKTARASFEKRFEWAKKIFKESFFEVSALEKSVQQTVFGKEIFYHLSAAQPNAHFFWILGEDQWEQLGFWKEIDQYAGNLEWLVLDRDSKKSATSGLLSRRLGRSTCAYEIAPVKPMAEISSTRIRKCIEEETLKANELKWIPKDIREDVVGVYGRKEDRT